MKIKVKITDEVAPTENHNYNRKLHKLKIKLFTKLFNSKILTVKNGRLQKLFYYK